MQGRYVVRILVVALGAALLAGGCGEEASPPASASAPQRIVSLSPTTTETLFAIGAGERVVAVDDQSDEPPEAPRTSISAYQPSVEAIAGHRPDLVVVSAETPRDAVAGLRRLGVRVLDQPPAANLAEAYAQMRELGEVTGRRAAAAQVADEMRAEVERLVASVPDGPPLRVFHELDPDLYSASSDTFIGQVYARLGLRNVADEAARRSGAEYPRMSAEAVVAADPDVIVLADSECCGQTPAKVARRPGWDAISAVRERAVVAVGDDVASRWGPRIPEFVERVVRAIEVAD
jgi:iron complex transport system substrate-binding protein